MAFDFVPLGFALAWPFFVCFFATRLTLRIASIGSVIYESMWYEYGLNLRKFTILIISRSHQPVYFTGFNLVRCTLESFLVVFYATFRNDSEIESSILN